MNQGAPRPMKHCCRCALVKSAEHFASNRRTKDGLQVWCKPCSAEYQRENKARIRAKRAEWENINRERRVQARKEYYTKNKARIDARNSQYVRENRERVAAYKRQWAQGNREQLRKRRASYYRENQERIKQAVKDYYRENRSAVLARSKAYRGRYQARVNAYVRGRYRNSKDARAAMITRSLLKRVLRALEQKKVYGSFETLGYTPDQLLQRMEVQFKPGMSWDNHGEWHIDHKISVANMIARGETRPHVINALSNLQPLWAKDNLRKGAYGRPRVL